MKNKLHLYGTLGPACCEKSLLKKMFAAGMTGVRLNLSHKSLDECSSWLAELSMAAEEYHIIPDLLVDLQGPELRIGTLEKDILCQKGNVFQLLPDDGAVADGNAIPVPETLLSVLEPGMLLKLNDGRILLQVKEVDSSGGLSAEVLREGPLSSRKSIACDQTSLTLPVLTPQDRETLHKLRRYRVTGVMQPFIKDSSHLIALKQELHKEGMDHIRVFAKIETREAAENLPELLPYCDEIVIARGDLGNAVPLETLPAWQKRISACCLHFKKPFMVVTQMLASMEQNPVPTRAELTDIFQAVLDGASSLMLTGETATGLYPLEAMQVLSDTSWEALRYKMESRLVPFAL